MTLTDPEKLREEIQAVADECDRLYRTDILATLLGGSTLNEVPDHELVPLLDKLYEEIKRHAAVRRATRT